MMYCFIISLLHTYLGLHESEKVFNDADIKNHRCFRDFRMTSSLRVSYNAHTTIQRDNMMKTERKLFKTDFFFYDFRTDPEAC